MCGGEGKEGQEVSRRLPPLTMPTVPLPVAASCASSASFVSLFLRNCRVRPHRSHYCTWCITNLITRWTRSSSRLLVGEREDTARGSWWIRIPAPIRPPRIPTYPHEPQRRGKPRHNPAVAVGFTPMHTPCSSLETAQRVLHELMAGRHKSSPGWPAIRMAPTRPPEV